MKIEGIDGSFQQKTIKGNKYWYYCKYDPTTRTMKTTFVGKDKPSINDEIPGVEVNYDTPLAPGSLDAMYFMVTINDRYDMGKHVRNVMFSSSYI